MNYTKIQHSTPYPSISPTLPALSAAGKTVLIVGASSGIAQATARAVLEAGCTRLALLSRRLPLLSPLVSKLETHFPGSRILTLAADIQDSKALEKAFTDTKDRFKEFDRREEEEAGEERQVTIDVVINCTGYAPTLAPVAGTGQADLADWWRGFEVNVLGAATLARVVTLHAGGGVLLQLGTAGALFPAQLPMSGYAASKLALVKLMEYVGAENPTLRVVTVHPGIVPGTEGGQNMVKESGIEWPGDDGKFYKPITRF
jgi:NAD(P)-dependent dehydrogenase (short-subunit alcohol dehydrogenase family)